MIINTKLLRPMPVLLILAVTLLGHIILKPVYAIVDADTTTGS